MAAMGRSARLRQAGQFTALVDILFATIGIFVIVFALQDLQTPSLLRPAPYDALILCGSDRVVRLYQSAETPLEFGARDISEKLAEAVASQGRVLIALSAECSVADNGVVLADRLRSMTLALSDRRAEGDELNLFEFAPLGATKADEEALLQRFSASAEADR